MPNLDRVQQEIINGRLWKARDRLLGLFVTYPNSQEVLELLGEVFYKMGDLPEAGRYWYLTECSDKLVQEAIHSFSERCGSKPCVMLKQLPIREYYEKYGPVALKRLQELLHQCPEEKQPRIKSYLPWEELEEMLEPSKWALWCDRLVSSLCLILLLGPWLAGFFTLAIWITSLIAPSLGAYLLTHWFDLLNLVKE